MGMAEYIERDKIRESYEKITRSYVNGDAYIADWRLDEMIESIPAADVAPVRHGRWEWFEEWSPSTPDHSAECDDCGWRCSECKTELEDTVGGYWDDPCEEPKLNYCPNCGAKMDGYITMPDTEDEDEEKKKNGKTGS